MKRVVSVFLTLFFLLFSASCGSRTHQKTIGVTLLTKQQGFYQDLERGLRQEAGKNGIRLLIQSADFSLARQASQVEDFISMKVDAIVVCPTDSAGIGSAIKEANAAGIAVFTADIAANSGKVVSHIASDNFAGGVEAARYLAKVLGEKGEIAILDQPEVTSVRDRVKGFETELARHPGIKIVAKPSAEGQRDKAMAVMENILEAHPQVKGIFGINDDSAFGALAALESAKRNDIVIVGYDATPEARQAISRGGSLKADVVQYPQKIGQMTIDAIVRYWNHENVKPLVPVKVGIVDQASLKAGKE